MTDKTTSCEKISS